MAKAAQLTKVEFLGPNRDGEPRVFTIADGTAASQGDLLALMDARTVQQASYGCNAIAGIAAEDHTASVGVTRISVWTQGLFTVKASGAVTIGTPLICGGPNYLKDAVDLVSGAEMATVTGFCGYCMDAAGDDTDTIVRLNR